MDAHSIQQLEVWLHAHWLQQNAARKFLTELEAALRPHNLSSNALFVLHTLRAAAPPGYTQIELARQLHLSPALMSGLLESMQDQHWIAVVRSPSDRRRLNCSLTEAGRSRYEHALSQLAHVTTLEAMPLLIQEAA